MSKLNPQKATAYVGPGVLRKGGKITPVPNGPLVKKKGIYAGSTLKSGGKIKKAQAGKKVTAVSTLTAPKGTTVDTKPKGRELTSSEMTRLTSVPKTKEERYKAVWTPSYDKSKEKAAGDTFEQWNDKFNKRTQETARKNPEPKGERTFFAKDNGLKSPCKGGKCFGNNKNGGRIKKAKAGGMIKRADGSYSKRGLWDNIRANKGSGKKPTKQMLVQEKKIKAKSKK